MAVLSGSPCREFFFYLIGHQFQFVPDPTGGNVFSYRANAPGERNVRYAVVTLNYDLVLERAAEYINQGFQTNLNFSRTREEASDGATYLAKLHGSTGPGDEIVPPTWNKTLSHRGVVPTWQLAYTLLAEAHYIRVLGYSLPISDSYVRYLLRAAVIDSRHQHLKNLDVVCCDPDGSVKARYDEFVRFHKFRFMSSRTEDYLQEYVGQHEHWPKRIAGDKLEEAHERFFQTSASSGVR